MTQPDSTINTGAVEALCRRLNKAQADMLQSAEIRENVGEFAQGHRNLAALFGDAIAALRATPTPAGEAEVIKETSLAECPPGLFWAGDTLGMKSEYGDNSGRIDAFIVESGEFLWGLAPQTTERQRAMRVRPVSYDCAIRALSPTKERQDD